MLFLKLEYEDTGERIECVKVEPVRTLERELNAANKIIADAKAYIEDVGDDFPEDGLLAILERKVTHDALGISPAILPKP
jgi:hypothetical protein